MIPNLKKIISALAAGVLIVTQVHQTVCAEEGIVSGSYSDGVYSACVRLPDSDMHISELSIDGRKAEADVFRQADESDSVKTTVIADRASLSDEGMHGFTGVLRELLAGSGENEYFRLVTAGKDGIDVISDFTRNQMLVLNSAESIEPDDESCDIAELLGRFFAGDSSTGESFERTIVFTSGRNAENADFSDADYSGTSLLPYFVITGNEAFSDGVFNESVCSGYCVLTEGADCKTAAELASDMSDIYILRIPFSDEITGNGGLKRISMVFENGMHTYAFEESVDTGDRRYAAAEKNLDRMKIILAVVSSAAFVLAALLVAVLRKKKAPAAVPVSVMPRQTVSLSKKRESRGTVFNSASTRILFRETPEMKIVLTDTENPDRVIEIPSSRETVIGRNQSLSDAVIYNERSVSQRHCRIFCRNSRVYAEDLGSLNHTYADGEEITSETEIFSGTILKIGRVSFEVNIE